MLALHDKRGNLGATIGAPVGGRTAARCNARRNTTHGIKRVVRILESVRGLFLLGYALRTHNRRTRPKEDVLPIIFGREGDHLWVNLLNGLFSETNLLSVKRERSATSKKGTSWARAICSMQPIQP